MKKTLHRFLYLSWLLGCTHLLGGNQADGAPVQSEGRVRVVGSEGSETTSLEGKDGKNTDLCMSPIAKRIGHLAGMRVRVQGATRSNGKPECIETHTFTVLDTGSGRDALVGSLSEENGSLLITRDDGSKQLLEKVPGGLKKLLGKKVIVDVKPMDGSKDGNTKSMRVVTYSEFP